MDGYVVSEAGTCVPKAPPTPTPPPPRGLSKGGGGGGGVGGGVVPGKAEADKMLSGMVFFLNFFS